MRTLPLLLLIASMFCAQATLAQKKGKLTPDVKEHIKTAKVLLYRFESPPINIMTPKDAAGAGLVSDLTKSDVGEEQQAAYRYRPDKLIQQNLDSMIRAEALMTNLTMVEEAFDFHMPAELKDLSRYGDVETGYIVEVIVPLMGWQASYGPANWKKYTLTLNVEVRIWDKGQELMVWKENFGHSGLSDDRLKFHIDDLQENGREKLTEMTKIAAFEVSRKVVEGYKEAKK